MYDKLAGMTGTAVTEAEEFHKIYKLEVVVIPTNRPMVREDDADFVYRTVERQVHAPSPRRSRSMHGDGTAGAGRHRLDRELRVPRRNARRDAASSTRS